MKNFIQLKIKTQFRLLLFFMIFLCLISGLLTYTGMKHLLTKNALTYTQNISQKFNSEINYLFARVSSIYDYFQYNSDIENIFLNPYTEKTQDYVKNIILQFTSYSIMNQDISDIAMVNEEIHWSSFFDKQTLTDFQNLLGYGYEMKSLGIKESPLSLSTAPLGPRLVFAKNIFSVEDSQYYGKALGSIILSIDPSKSPINLPSLEENEAYFILADQSFNTYPFNCSDTFCDFILNQCEDLYELTKTPEAFTNFPFLQDSKNYLFSINFLPDVNYYVISAIDKHQMNQDLTKITNLLWLSVFIILLLVIFIMYLLSKNMVKPINQLYTYIKNTQQIKVPFEQGIPSEIHLYGCEEIHSLGEAFNTMNYETNRLNRELYTAMVSLYQTKLGKKQAELDYLRSQINPHFLYNSLELIKNIAIEKKNPSIKIIATAMGRLFRYNVKGKSIVPFSDELEITKAYLDIQCARFPEKVTPIYSIREETLSIPVMKLMLQPLIENAIYHGLEPKDSIGIIFIGSKLEKVTDTEQVDLVITVQDDGIGIPEKTMKSIEKKLSSMDFKSKEYSEHTGLLNVHFRLRLHYGKPYGLSIESYQDNGTKITLRLPTQLTKKKEN